MKKNVGNTDKVIRIVLGLLFGILYFTNSVTGTLGIIFLVFGFVFIITSLIGFCPIYPLFGINTCPNKQK